MDEIKFTVTNKHLKLLRKMMVTWNDCETGAPTIDPKRPYGNSLVAVDIHEILTGESDVELSITMEDRYMSLHRELEKALQIVLRGGSFTPGIYVANRYMRDWRVLENG